MDSGRIEEDQRSTTRGMALTAVLAGLLLMTGCALLVAVNHVGKTLHSM